MSITSRIALAACACLILGGCGAGENPAHSASALANAPSFDLEGVAHEVVTRNAGVKQGDRVLITGGPNDIELMENLAVHVRRAGAHALVAFGSDRMSRRLYDDVPEQFDSQPDPWFATVASATDVVISVTGGDPATLAHVPPQRLAARRDANAPLYDMMMRTATVELGNGLYPSETAARHLGVPRDELARMFWDGIRGDPARLAESGRAVMGALRHGATVRITSPAGTDLTLRITGAAPRMNDGVVPADSDYRTTWLPAGEAYVAVGGASGRVVLERHLFQGTAYRDITLLFEDGRLTAMESPDPLAALRDMLDNAPAGWEQLGALDIGLNPGITSHRVLSFVTSGMVTLFVGDNRWAGGDIGMPFGHAFHVPGATVRVDDRVIVEDGVLKL